MLTMISYIVWTISTVIHLVLYLYSINKDDSTFKMNELVWLGISMIMCRLEWLIMMSGG